MANLDFTDAFRYPFRRWQGLLNILWILVPIYGWFLLIGYRVRIVGEFLQGKYTKLPRIAHGDDFVLGWKMFWKAIPGLVVIIAAGALMAAFDEEWLALLFVILVLLIVPILAMNFIRKRTVASCFEFDLVRVVVKNFLDYFVAFLKDLALALIFFVMIFILVGIPASVFTKNMFLAEFYRGHVKK